MIKFEDDVEANFWMNIYSKVATEVDSYVDGDPYAAVADIAVTSLRLRFHKDTKKSSAPHITEIKDAAPQPYHNSREQ